MEVRTKFAVDDIVEYDGRTAKVVKVELYEDVHNEVNYQPWVFPPAFSCFSLTFVI